MKFATNEVETGPTVLDKIKKNAAHKRMNDCARCMLITFTRLQCTHLRTATMWSTFDSKLPFLTPFSRFFGALRSPGRTLLRNPQFASRGGYRTVSLKSIIIYIVSDCSSSSRHNDSICADRGHNSETLAVAGLIDFYWIKPFNFRRVGWSHNPIFMYVFWGILNVKVNYSWFLSSAEIILTITSYISAQHNCATIYIYYKKAHMWWRLKGWIKLNRSECTQPVQKWLLKRQNHTKYKPFNSYK